MKTIPFIPHAAASDWHAQTEGLNRELRACITLAAAGDMDAFERLYEVSAKRLLSLVRRMVGPDHAEDVLAEVFLQAWRQLGQYDSSRGEPMLWLSVIARTRALDWLRREGPRMRSEVTFDGMDLEDTWQSRPEENLAFSQECAQLNQAIGMLLSSKERMVLALAFFRDCTSAEIAKMTGLPLGTVKSLVRRAQGKLRLHFTGGSSPRAAATMTGTH